jgi:tRNA-dihydrouridine synthase C
MQGIGDATVRGILSEIGGMDACVAPFVRVSVRPVGERALARECPELRSGARTSAGVPVHVQLLGAHPAHMAETAACAVSLGAQAVDLNFGCPVGRVNRHDGGAALLREPARITRIAQTVRRAVPDSIAVSAKVRLGWEKPSEVTAIVQAAEAAGVDWVTVHGRTRDQLYDGRANWSAIGVARSAVRIPVVANGDLRSPEDLAACRAVTGCEHFMVGRGALSRPELFRVMRGSDRSFWKPSRRIALLLRFAAADLVLRRSESVLGRLKAWCHYMAFDEPAIAEVFASLRLCQTLDGAIVLLRAHAG